MHNPGRGARPAEKGYESGMLHLALIAERGRAAGDGDSRLRINECNLCGYVWSARGGCGRPKVCPECRSSLWDRPDVRKAVCCRCGHEWITDSHPVMCPSCKSRRWENELLPLECRRCGIRWNDALKRDDPVTCPKCGILGAGEYKVGKIRKKALNNKGSPMDEKVLKEMRSIDKDVFIAACLRNHGLTPDQADIIVRFNRGESVPCIASDMSVPVSAVMNAILPYMELCESAGMKARSRSLEYYGTAEAAAVTGKRAACGVPADPS